MSNHQQEKQQQQHKQEEDAAVEQRRLQQLKAAAEAEMRRPAPPLSASTKRRKTGPSAAAEASAAVDEEEDGEASDDNDAQKVGRFAYAAPAAIAAGSMLFLGTCGFNRQRSAAKELMNLLPPLLPAGTQLQAVKVACCGLAVLRIAAGPAVGSSTTTTGDGDAASAQPADTAAAAAAAAAAGPPVSVMQVVEEVLARIQSKRLPHTKFCERVIPAETTCFLEAAALEAALARVTRAHVQALLRARQQQQQQQRQQEKQAGEQQEEEEQGALQFAVLYKNRGLDAAAAAAAAEAPSSSRAAGGTAAAAPGGQAGLTKAAPLDRGGIIDRAAAAMQAACSELGLPGGARVNLKHPQAVVMVEVIPLQQSQLACAVSVLPRSLLSSSSSKLKIQLTGSTALQQEGGSSKGKHGRQGRRGGARGGGRD